MKVKRGLIIISILCVITLIVVAGWFTLPKLLADNAIVNDIKITSEVQNQQITLSVSDQNQQDTKVMIPLDPNLEYQSTDQQAGVTYDAEEHQLVIDWFAEQSKQVTIKLKALKVGTYQLQAQVVREGQMKTSVPDKFTVTIANHPDSLALDSKYDSLVNHVERQPLDNNRARAVTSGTIGTCSWSIDTAGILHISEGELGNFKNDWAAPWKTNVATIIGVSLDGVIKAKGSINGLFAGIMGSNAGTQGIELQNLTNLDTANVTDMKRLFYNSGFKSLDVSAFNTKKVTSFEDMFRLMPYITNLNLKSFDSSNVISMCTMFSDDAGIEALDLSTFDTSNVQDMTGMFAGMTYLKELDVSTFNTDNVESMSGMFSYDGYLEKLDLSSFTIPKIKSKVNKQGLQLMFNSCANLKYLDISNFAIPTNTRNIAVNMFKSANSLISLKIGPGWHNSENTALTPKLPANYTSRWTSDTYPGVSIENPSRDVDNFGAGEWHRSRIDYSRLEVKDSTIYVGDTWQPADNFVKAIDFDGNNLTVDQVRVQGTVDTETPGSYPVTYSLKNGSKSKTITVKVKSGVLTFTKHPESISFEDSKIAAQTQNVQLKPTDLAIEINDSRPKRSAWRLELQLVDNFKANNGDTLKTPLIYQTKDTQQEQILTPGNSITVYTQAANNQVEDYTFDLATKSQLLMRVLPGTVKVGTYTGDFLWTLTDAPA